MTSRRDALSMAAGATGALMGAGAVRADNRTQLAQKTGTYRAWEIGEQKSIYTLRLVERPMPMLAQGEVAIRVEVTSINALAKPDSSD